MTRRSKVIGVLLWGAAVSSLPVANAGTVRASSSSSSSSSKTAEKSRRGLMSDAYCVVPANGDFPYTSYEDLEAKVDRKTVFSGECVWNSILASDDRQGSIDPDIANLTNLALSADGLKLLVGSIDIEDNRGGFQVYHRESLSASSWKKYGRLVVGDSVNDYLGISVDMSDSGNKIVVSSYNGDDGLTNEGQVDVYGYRSAAVSYVQGTWGLDNSFVGDSKFQLLGKHVAMSGDGSTVAFSAPFFKDAVMGVKAFGKIEVHEFNTGTNSWSQVGQPIVGADVDELGFFDISISDDGRTLAFPSDMDKDQSTVRVYAYDSGKDEWEMETELFPPDVAELQGVFGSRMDMASEGHVIAVADSTWKDGMTVRGRVLMYHRVESGGSVSWNLGDILEGTNSTSNYGSDVALSKNGEILVVGESGANQGDGMAHIYKYDNGKSPGSRWTLIGELDDPHVSDNKSGTRVQVSADGRTVGMSSKPEPSSDVIAFPTVRCYSFY